MFACDVWSFGVTFYEIIAGKFPFEGSLDDGTYIKNLKDQSKTFSDIPAYVPDDLNALLSQMLNKDPSKRMTIKSILD